MAYFLSKLIPPRPTFVLDMSDEERNVMLAHRDYWLPQLNAGLVLLMGPVLDPKGGYGVMVANAPSLKLLEDWQSQDPVILSGRGFLFENYPMPSIKVAPIEPLAPVSSISP
ncbi:MAG TPA: YciI family protein [Roseiarcus sp.]|nr:YciI family protein [Roseiarcus sp.]